MALYYTIAGLLSVPVPLAKAVAPPAAAMLLHATASYPADGTDPPTPARPADPHRHAGHGRVGQDSQGSP